MDSHISALSHHLQTLAQCLTPAKPPGPLLCHGQHPESTPRLSGKKQGPDSSMSAWMALILGGGAGVTLTTAPFHVFLTAGDTVYTQPQPRRDPEKTGQLRL